MTVAVRISQTCISVYKLAILAVPQSRIAVQLGLSKSTVSKHIETLVMQEFLELTAGKKGTVKIYDKGAKANVLDSIIAEQTVRPQFDASGSKKRHSTGVRRCSQSDTYFVTALNAHHLAFKRLVGKDGDWQMFSRSQPSELNNNVSVFYAQIPSTDVQYKNTKKLLGYVPKKDDRFITVRLYQSIQTDTEGNEHATLTMHVHMPQLILTESDLSKLEPIGREIARDVYEHFTKKHGWYFSSDIEITNWEAHIATPAPYLNNFTNRADVWSSNRRLHSSFSDSIAEVEANGKPKDAEEAIREYLNLPADMRSAECRLDFLENNGDRIIRMLERNQDAFIRIAENEGIRLNLELYRSKQEEQKPEPIAASDFGGMYQ